MMNRYLRSLSYPAMILALTAVYFLSGKFGLSLAFVHKSASAVWPPTGIALVAVLLLGPRVWPGLFLGAFLVNITTAGTFVTSLGIGTGNTLEALLGAHLVRRYAKGRQAFDRAGNVFRFVILAGMVSPVVSATFGVTSLSLGGFAAWDRYSAIWSTWWLGDMVSAILIAPLLIIWITKPFPRIKFSQWFEILFLVILVWGVGQIVFGGWLFSQFGYYPLEYLGIPLLLYAVFRFGQHGAITMAFMMSVIAIRGTLHGFGPFASRDPNEALLLLQAFTATVTLTALTLAAAVSERLRLENILRRREGQGKFRSVTETANDAIICANSRGEITYFNRAARNVFGYSFAEVMGLPLTVLMPERFQDAHRRGLIRFLTTGETRVIGKTVELAGKKRDGTEFPVELSIASWKIKDEIAFSAILRDLTLQKKAEEMLERKNASILLLQMITVGANQAETVEEAIQICLNEICVHMNWPVGHAYILPPTGPRELVSTRIWYLRDPERFKPFRKVTEACRFPSGKGLPGIVLATEKAHWSKDINQDAHFLRKSVAREVGLKCGFAFPVFSKKESLAVLEFFSDQVVEPNDLLLEITPNIGSQIGRVVERALAKKALESAHDELEMRVEERTAALKRANEKLKKLDDLKSNFILTASHELRTPLTSVKGYVMLILEEKTGTINKMQREFLGHVKNATDRLQRLLSELLSISKIESGQVSMNREEVEIAELLKEEILIFKAEAEQRQIALDLHIKNDLKTIACDPDKIREVIANLITNAFKFTPPNGKVQVLAARQERGIEIQVKDTGIGIKPEELEKIFEPFHYVHKKGLGGEESTGLGLALAKGIVEAHKGEIYVESAEGKGSTFYVVLPLKI